MNERFWNELQFLKDIAEDVLRRCTVTMKASYTGEEKDTALLIPGGDNKYPSFWVRDCCMNTLCGLVSGEDMRRYITIMASCGQNGPETVYLKNGLEIPPWTLADHINYNGRGVWYPGTYDDGDDQGKGDFGFYPPLGDNYWFILLVGQYVLQTGDKDILNEVFAGYRLKERLIHAWEGYNTDPEIGMTTSDYERYAIDWGFTDTIHKSGKLLFSSLLRYNAGLTLAVLLEEQGEDASEYVKKAEILRKAIVETLYDKESGWFYAATERCHQRDVWGTLYALWSGILSEEDAAKTAKAVAAEYKNGNNMVSRGYVRQILRSDDAKPGELAWQDLTFYHGKYDWYQNGGYWATATGWLFWALYLADPALAEEAVCDYCSHTREYAEQGSPFEWKNIETTDLSGLWYGTSGALVYQGVLRIAMEEAK